MNWITIETNAEDFIERMNTIRSRFPQMVETMRKVAMVIEHNTQQYVPEDTTALVQSFDAVIKPSSDFILMAVGYDAEDEDNGYHYAEIQHNKSFHHPKRTARDHYLVKGIMDSKMEMFEMINTDYLSMLMGNSIGGATTGSTNGLAIFRMIGGLRDE